MKKKSEKFEYGRWVCGGFGFGWGYAVGAVGVATGGAAIAIPAVGTALIIGTGGWLIGKAVDAFIDL